MNVQVLHGIRRLNNVYPKLRFIRNAQTKAESAELDILVKQAPQLSQSFAGITVFSIENYHPLSQVAVAIKAGSRYEQPGNLGITHCLRSAACSSTQMHSTFALTKLLESNGIKLDVTGTREHLIYTLTCLRDHFDMGMETLSEIISKWAFKKWELQSTASKMQIDRAIHKNQPESILIEALHEAAFKGGLSNSLYSPKFMIGKHDPEMLLSFVNEAYTNSRISVVGLGVPHDHLQERVDKLIELPNHVLQNEATKFVPREVRIERDTPFTHVAIVAEGASLTNNKDLLSLGLLQCIFGLGTSPNIRLSKLGEAAAKKTNSPFHVSSLNVSYSDSGLFGVYISANHEDMNEVIKAVVTEMRSITKNISENDIAIAKQKLKTHLLIERDTTRSTLTAMAQEISQFGQLKSTATVEKAIDDIKLADVAAVASKVIKAKPAMAAVGRLHATPHIDELV